MIVSRLKGSMVAAAVTVMACAGTATATGPIAYWNMDEAALSPAALDSVGIADAIAGAAADGNLPVAGVAGILGTAWSFDGSNDSALSIAPPNQAAFTGLGFSGWSYSGWINSPIGAGGADTAFSITDAAAGSEEAALRVNNGALNFLGRHNGNPNVDITGSLVNDGQWHHVAVVSSAAGGTILYLDGSPDASSPDGVDIATFTANDNNVSVNFGANNDNGANLQWEYAGLIDEFSVYDFALSAGDVGFLAANPGATVPEPASLALIAGAIGCVSLRRSKI